MIVAGYYGITLGVRLSVCPSVCHTSIHLPIFLFPNDNSKCQWIFTKLGVCELILWRSGFGLLMGKFSQFLTNLSDDLKKTQKT